MSSRPSPGRHGFGPDFAAPADLTDAILFGDVWRRPGLSPRERSLITVAALVALGHVEPLSFHLAFALDNGVTRAELTEAITHLAFYAGWPAAATAAERYRAMQER